MTLEQNINIVITTQSQVLNLSHAKSLKIVENIEEPTQSMVFSIPLNDYIKYLNYTTLQFEPKSQNAYGVENNNIIKLSNYNYYPITVYAGYNGELETIFIGYIIDFYLVGEDVIEFKCEDEMYMLKTTTNLRYTFPVDLQKDIFKNLLLPNLATAPQEQSIETYKERWNKIVDKYPGKMKLHHILHFMFNLTLKKQVQFDAKGLPENTQANRYSKYDVTYPIFCEDIQMGKVKFNDFLHIAEFLDMQSKKGYGFYHYFKLRELYANVRVPCLYIGNKYLTHTYAINLTTFINQDILESSKDHPEQIGILPQKTINEIYFSYPYCKGFNPIIQHDIKYRKTNDDEHSVLVISLDTKTNQYTGESIPDSDLQYYEIKDRQLLTQFRAEEKALKKREHELEGGSVDEDKKIKDAKGKYKKPIADMSPKEIQKEQEQFIKEEKAFKDRYQEFYDKEYDILSKRGVNTEKYEFRNLTRQECRNIATRKYNEYKTSGFYGSFLTYGKPFVTIGDIVILQLSSAVFFNESTPAGAYYVDKVERIYDETGYFQRITLGNAYIEPGSAYIKGEAVKQKIKP